jgi:hypothetical protein
VAQRALVDALTLAVTVGFNVVGQAVAVLQQGHASQLITTVPRQRLSAGLQFQLVTVLVEVIAEHRVGISGFAAHPTITVRVDLHQLSEIVAFAHMHKLDEVVSRVICIMFGVVVASSRIYRLDRLR